MDFVVTNTPEHISQRREHFIREITRLFAEAGFRSLTIDKIAQNLGVKKVVLYRYFESKDALLHEVFQSATDRLLELDAQPVGWREVNRQILKDLRNDPSGFLMLTRHVANDPDFSEYFDSYFERLVGRSKRRLKEALPTPLRKPMTYDFCARALCRVVIQNMAAWVETGPKKNDDAFIDWLNRTIIAMSVSWQE